VNDYVHMHLWWLERGCAVLHTLHELMCMCVCVCVCMICAYALVVAGKRACSAIHSGCVDVHVCACAFACVRVSVCMILCATIFVCNCDSV
jgi:hypothetical protein